MDLSLRSDQESTVEKVTIAGPGNRTNQEGNSHVRDEALEQPSQGGLSGLRVFSRSLKGRVLLSAWLMEHSGQTTRSTLTTSVERGSSLLFELVGDPAVIHRTLIADRSADNAIRLNEDCRQRHWLDSDTLGDEFSPIPGQAKNDRRSQRREPRTKVQPARAPRAGKGNLLYI